MTAQKEQAENKKEGKNTLKKKKTGEEDVGLE